MGSGIDFIESPNWASEMSDTFKAYTTSISEKFQFAPSTGNSRKMHSKSSWSCWVDAPLL